MFLLFRNYAASIAITCKSVSKRPHTFITAITQIRTFSFNLGASKKNFEITKYTPEKVFSKGIIYKYKQKIRSFQKNTAS